MGIQWTPLLSVGIEQVDEQHRELFRRANRLLEAMQAQRSAPELARMLEFLASYAREHFREEEELMGREGYPGLAAHRTQHEDLARALAELRADHGRDGPTSLLAIRANHLVCDWLLLHVSRQDREFGAWLETSQRRVAG